MLSIRMKKYRIILLLVSNKIEYLNFFFYIYIVTSKKILKMNKVIRSLCIVKLRNNSWTIWKIISWDNIKSYKYWKKRC